MRKRSFNKMNSVNGTYSGDNPYEALQMGVKKFSTKRRKPNNKTSLLAALKKQVFNHEKKYLDTAVSAGYNINGLATITLLNNCVTGTDEITRVGRQINIKNITMKGIVASGAATLGGGLIRTMIILDTQPNAALFAIGALLVSDSLESLNNLDNRKRFISLHNSVVRFGGVGTSVGTLNAGGNPTSQYIEFYKKCDIGVEYNSVDGGTIADITKNALYLVTYSSSLAGTALGVILNIRLRFTDN